MKPAQRWLRDIGTNLVEAPFTLIPNSCLGRKHIPNLSFFVQIKQQTILIACFNNSNKVNYYLPLHEVLSSFKNHSRGGLVYRCAARIAPKNET